MSLGLCVMGMSVEDLSKAIEFYCPAIHVSQIKKATR
jgi:hypothetical protein